MKKWFIYLVDQLKRWCERKLRAEDEKTFRSSQKKIDESRKASLKHNQEQCRHIAGCNPLSEQFDPAGRTSIVWHTLDTRETVGICTVCLREFFPSDPDYQVWIERRSFSKPSKAGARTYLPSAEPHLARFSDPPTSAPMPAPVYRNGWEDDPWLLDALGNRDPFVNVDFGGPYQEMILEVKEADPISFDNQAAKENQDATT